MRIVPGGCPTFRCSLGTLSPSSPTTSASLLVYFAFATIIPGEYFERPQALCHDRDSGRDTESEIFTLCQASGKKKPDSKTSVCQKCLKGGRGHTGHLTTADNCLLYGETNPTKETYERVMKEHEAAFKQDDAATRATLTERGNSPAHVPATTAEPKKMKHIEKGPLYYTNEGARGSSGGPFCPCP